MFTEETKCKNIGEDRTAEPRESDEKCFQIKLRCQKVKPTSWSLRDADSSRGSRTSHNAGPAPSIVDSRLHPCFSSGD